MLSSALALLGFVGWREKETLVRWKDQIVNRISGVIQPPPEVAAEEPEKDTPPPTKPNVPPANPAPVTLPPPPEGVYFLSERVSVTTDAGVRSYAAATRVTKTGENLGLFVVSDGKTSFSVESGKLTRDMALVDELRRKAAEAAAKARDNRTLPPPVPAAPKGKGGTGASADPAKAERDATRRKLQADLAAVDRQIAAVQGQIYTANSQQSTSRRSGKISSASVGVAGMQNQLREYEQQRARINSAILALPR